MGGEKDINDLVDHMAALIDYVRADPKKQRRKNALSVLHQAKEALVKALGVEETLFRGHAEDIPSTAGVRQRKWNPKSWCKGRDLKASEVLRNIDSGYHQSTRKGLFKRQRVRGAKWIRKMTAGLAMLIEFYLRRSIEEKNGENWVTFNKPHGGFIAECLLKNPGLARRSKRRIIERLNSAATERSSSSTERAGARLAQLR